MTAEAAEPRSLLRRLYDWCLTAAHKPHALWIMGAVPFAESSFFPVPPDIMLIPMALARPERAYVMAAWCTVTSVAGGLLGYSIGALHTFHQNHVCFGSAVAHLARSMAVELAPHGIRVNSLAPG